MGIKKYLIFAVLLWKNSVLEVVRTVPSYCKCLRELSWPFCVLYLLVCGAMILKNVGRKARYPGFSYKVCQLRMCALCKTLKIFEFQFLFKFYSMGYCLVLLSWQVTCGGSDATMELGQRSAARRCLIKVCQMNKGTLHELKTTPKCFLGIKDF